MEKDGLVKKADGISPHFYHLPYQTRYNNITYKHEKIGGDIYVYCRELIEYWDYLEHADFLEYKLKPDRQSVMAGKIIMWELNRATMTKAKIIQKIEKYIQFAQNNQKRFTIAFATTPRRAKSIAEEFDRYRNGNVWFTAVDVSELIQNPHGEVFLTLGNGDAAVIPEVVTPVSGTLMAHAGASKITREELALIPAVEETDTFKPIAHSLLIDQLEEALSFRHIQIVRDEYAVSKDGMRLFGLLELNAEYEDLRFAIGLINANDKSMRLGMVAGYRVFVCDNMALN